jgi:predicted metal-binding protein
MQASKLDRVLYCEEARRLLRKYGEIVNELIIHHQQQFTAVLEGDFEAHRFDLLIHDASERKQNAKYAYLFHVENHACGLCHEIDES